MSTPDASVMFCPAALQAAMPSARLALPDLVWRVLANEGTSDEAEAKTDLEVRRAKTREENLKQAEIIRRRMVATKNAAPAPVRLTSIDAEETRLGERVRALREGAIGRLFRKGALSASCMRAAEELGMVYLIRQDGQLTVVPLAERVDTSCRGGTPRYLDAAAGHFARWRDDLIKGSGAFGGPMPLVYGVTVGCVAYDYTLAEAQKRLGIKRNSAPGEYLRLGLQHYADIMDGQAGRVRRDPALRKGA